MIEWCDHNRGHVASKCGRWEIRPYLVDGGRDGYTLHRDGHKMPGHSIDHGDAKKAAEFYAAMGDFSLGKTVVLSRP